MDSVSKQLLLYDHGEAIDVEDVRDAVMRIEELIATLEIVREYLNKQADVVDGDYGEPRPNTAMSLSQYVTDVIGGN